MYKSDLFRTDLLVLYVEKWLARALKLAGRKISNLERFQIHFQLDDEKDPTVADRNIALINYGKG